MDERIQKRSEAYLDDLFGDGAGKRHTSLIERFDSAVIQETLHRYHVLESDTQHIGLEENYLLGMVVLCASKNFTSASMFAKTLMHLGTPREKILEAVGRLSMWIGGIPAAEALGHIQKAVKEYERDGFESMQAWFPGPEEER